MKKRSLTPVALLAALAGTALGQSTDPFPAHFELFSLLPFAGGDGSDGFVINGIGNEDRCGFTVSSAGDINGDGIDDVLIGAYNADPNGDSDAGQSYVVFGAPNVGSGGTINLSSLDGTNGFAMNGSDRRDISGRSVSSAGDINGDGFDDVLIGAPLAGHRFTIESGASYVVFGKADVGSGGAIELSLLNGSDGFEIFGFSDGDSFGNAVSCVGDLNGDGTDDIIVGANRATANGTMTAGQIYVFYGAANIGASGTIHLSSISGTAVFVINGIDTLDNSGFAVSSAGDINGDGIDDLVIGAYSADPNGQNRAGESYVVFGVAAASVGHAINLSSLNGTDGFIINGIETNDASGVAVSSAGDVNGDGIDDLIIGAYSAVQNGVRSGESYVIFGAQGVGSSGVLELSSLDGTNGFVLIGIDNNDRSGISVSSAGDVNGDGIDDLIIGAEYANPNGRFAAGECYVVFGNAALGSTGQFELASLNGTNGFVLNGIGANDRCGRSVASAGDVNADGIDDLIIGAPFLNVFGSSGSGESYVVFGRNTVLTPCDSDTDHDGEVGFADITFVLSNWLNDYTPGTGPGDANLDGTVSFADITTVLGNWLVECP